MAVPASEIAASAEASADKAAAYEDARKRIDALLDVDSDRRAAFEETDREFLESLCRTLGGSLGEAPAVTGTTATRSESRR
jgi:putative methionine-R-sulfoxide reductase with GAF domain